MMLLKENPTNNPSMPPTDPTRSIVSIMRNSSHTLALGNSNLYCFKVFLCGKAGERYLMHKVAYLMLAGESTGRKRVVGTHKMKRPTKQAASGKRRNSSRIIQP